MSADPDLSKRANPPTDWCDWWTDITCVTDDIYYGWPENDPGTNPWFWHWCTKHGRWNGASTSDHTLVAREPLHLEPSLLWPCCGLHGWCRNGEWTSA